jgi:Subunit ChlI of Mg-chelatase
MTTAGLPDSAVRESRERVRTVIHDAGLAFPTDRTTVSLAPDGCARRAPPSICPSPGGNASGRNPDATDVRHAAESIGGITARLTEPPFPPGTARPTSVSRDSLPEQGACPEGCPRPTEQTSATAASARRSGAEHPAGLGGSPAAPGGARPSRSRDSASAARIGRIASGSSTVAINRSRPPQRGHASTSRSKARRISAAHAQWRGADFDVSLASEHGLAGNQLLRYAAADGTGPRRVSVARRRP